MSDSTYRYGAHVRANGIRQHYLRYGGAGTPLVLIPGITSPAATWGFVAERFGRFFDTYVLDVRGRGLSESGAGLDYRLDALAADVAAFADALDLRDYALVGHSMGGRIAIRAARAHPLQASRIVLVDPPVSGPGRRPYPANLAWYVDSMRLMREAAGIDALRPFSPTWSDDQLRLRAEWLPTCDEQAVITAFHGFQEDDIHADLPRIATPMRLIAAGRGDVITPEELAEIRMLAPGIETCRVEAAGHMIPWDDFDGFFRAFGDFLGRSLQEE
jgi:N-formylmaleamate deformylase